MLRVPNAVFAGIVYWVVALALKVPAAHDIAHIFLKLFNRQKPVPPKA